MQLWRGCEAVPAGYGPCVVSMGVFDGVHRGHQILISLAIARARALGIACVVMTFYPHPSAIVRPARQARQLTTLRRRLELIEALGVDACLVVDFTPEFAALSPADFVEQILIGRLGAADVAVGANFTFGARGAGTASTLTDLSAARGVPVTVLSLQTLDGDDGPVNSTGVRAAAAAGDMALAAHLLGRPHRLEGVLVSAGSAVALDVDGFAAVPAPGTYPVQLVIGTRVLHTKAQMGPQGLIVAGLDPVLLGRRVALDFLGT